MEDQQIIAVIEQQRLRDAYLSEQIARVTRARDREFATELVEKVLGYRNEAAITWVIQRLWTF